MERVLPIDFFTGEDLATETAADIQLEREAQEALLLRELEREAGELSEEGLLQRLHDERVQGEQRRQAARRGLRNPRRAAWDALGFGRDLATGRRVRR